MKHKNYQIFSYLFLIAFFAYWLIVFMLAMPPNALQQKLAHAIPRFKTIFTSSWKLFSPPYIYHNRLYYIVRDANKPGKTDTIEVLEQIVRKKQIAAPFNQKENIIDCSVNNNVTGLINIISKNKKKPENSVPGTADSIDIALAIEEAVNNNKFMIYLGTLENYAKIAIKEKNIDPAGKEVKIVIKEKMIRPFKEMKNQAFIPTETLVFETPYQPVRP